MNYGKALYLVLASLALAVAGCGGGSNSPAPELLTALQDLALDPDGHRTVLTLTGSGSSVKAGQLAASGGQSALLVEASGASLSVLWNERVTPSHQVRLGEGEWIPVATSDSSVPVFVVEEGVQLPGLGGDVLHVRFSGPRVVPETVLDEDNWSLEILGQTLSLAGSELEFDVEDQLLTIVTGPMGNLHASFGLRGTGLTSVADVPLASGPVAGVAAGDAVPPVLLSAVQRLEHDEFGRVIEFTFDKAMSPVFATQQTNFASGFLLFASSVEQVEPETLRVNFQNPVVPGLMEVALLNVRDVHGNALTLDTPVSAGSVVQNDYSQDPQVETVAGLGNDRLVVWTEQALAPSSAIQANLWALEVDGAPVDLSGALFSYNLAARRLTVQLGLDVANGLDFTLTPDGVVDVDGAATLAPFQGQTAGDEVAPTVVSALQNRSVDPQGRVVDITFSEAVTAGSAELLGNYAASGGQAVLSASLSESGLMARVTFDDSVIPGVDFVDIAGVLDPAGNTMQPVFHLAPVSSDTTPPVLTLVLFQGQEGPANDRIEVAFDDWMFESDVLDPSRWLIESPLGTDLNPFEGTLTYDSETRRAKLLFDGPGAPSFQFGADFSLVLSGMRDLGGNTIAATPQLGVVETEGRVPAVEAVWRRDEPFENQIWVRFDEPVANFADEHAIYRLEDGAGFLLGTPTVPPTLSADGRGVLLTFGLAVVPGVHVLDVRGVTDLAGNQMFPVVSHGIAGRDPLPVGLDLGASDLLTVSGENNDRITVVLDRSPSRWQLLAPWNFELLSGGDPLSLEGAELSWDGDRTIELLLAGGANLQTGAHYTLRIFGLTSAQGVPMDLADQDLLMAFGDVQPPTLAAGSVRVDASQPADRLLVEFDEAVDLDGATDPASYFLMGFHPDLVESAGPRTMRLTFPGGFQLGDTLDAEVRDLAGNLGLMSRALEGASENGPLVSSVEGIIAPGLGGDRVIVRFNRPVDFASAGATGNYHVLSGGVPLELAQAQTGYSSVGNEVTLFLPAGVELRAGEPITVTVSGVLDHAGLELSPVAVVNGPVSGDVTPPAVDGAFVNGRLDPTGRTIDVGLSEDVVSGHVADPANWNAPAGNAVVSVSVLKPSRLRVTLAQPLGQDETLTLIDVPDMAGNVAALLVIDPM